MKTAVMLFSTLLILGCPSWALAAPEAPFKAAVVQFNPVLNERQINVEKLAQALEEAAANGARLIVAPEMSTTGYAYADRKAIEPYVDTIPGLTTDFLTAVAARHNAYIVIGLPEKEASTDLYYNSAALIGPQGVIGKYRKSHLWEAEAHWSAWGDLGVPVFETELGRIAINICFDSAFYEPARLAGLGQADILAFPTNSTSQAIWALQARALQNGLYVLSANRSNTELGYHMIGGSAIWSPQGDLLTEAPLIKTEADDVNEPAIFYADINPKLYDNEAKKSLKQRRPELYHDLMLKVSPWNYKASSVAKEVTALSLQYGPESSPQKALNKIEKLISNRDDQSPVDLIVLPAYALTGPPKDRQEAALWSEKVNGPHFNSLKKISSQYKSYLIFGFIEQDGENLYSTAAMISPDGEVLGLYRKTHLSEAEKKWAKAGNEFQVITTPLGKIGLMLGGEELFPEVGGILSVKRADIIAMPASWDGSHGKTVAANGEMVQNKYPANASCLWDSLALTAQAYTIVANFYGGEGHFVGSGGLYALDPLYGLDQTITAPAEVETALQVKFTTLAKDWWFNQFYANAMRRPDLYQPLLGNYVSGH